MKESRIEARLTQGVKALGGIAYKFVSPGNVGVPDRLVILPGGKVIFVELKTDTGRLSPMQAHQIRELRRRDAEVWVVYGEDSLKSFLEACRGYIAERGGAK